MVGTDDYSMKLGLGDGNGTLTFSGDSVNAGGVDAVKDIGERWIGKRH